VEALSGYNIYRIAAGTHHSLCTDEDGNLIAFGRGDSGQLGITDRQPAPSYFEPRPVILKVLEDEGDKADVSQISCGGNHNLVITRKGSVYTWGYGEQHALGHGVGKDEYCPRKLNVFAGKRTSLGVKVHQVAGGGQHSAFICTIDEEQAMHAS
jgi:alpha-tubulin suppressor-like RCC1 family protein